MKNLGIVTLGLVALLVATDSSARFSGRKGGKPRCEKDRIVTDSCPADADLVYSCERGTLEGKRCVWDKEVTESCPADRETVYTCPEGKTLNGKRCEWPKLVQESCPAQAEEVYSCPPDTRLVG